MLRQAGSITSLGIAAGIAGCTSGGDGEAETTETTVSGGGETTASGGTPTQAVFNTDLATVHYPQVSTSLSILVAKEKGFFAEHGVEIGEISSFVGGGSNIRGISTGGIGIGTGALAAGIQAFMAGAPVHLVGFDTQHAEIEFVVLPDSPIETIQDLAGKTLATSGRGSSTEATALLSIQEADGISVDDVNIQRFQGLGDIISAINEGVVDAGWIPQPIATLWFDQGKYRRLFRGNEYVNFTSQTLIMGARVLDLQPENARSVLAAWADAHEYIRNNVEESATLWANNSDFKKSFLLKSMEGATFDAKEIYGLTPPMEGVQMGVEALRLTGLLGEDEGPDLEEYARTEFLPEDLQPEWDDN